MIVHGDGGRELFMLPQPVVNLIAAIKPIYVVPRSTIEAVLVWQVWAQHQVMFQLTRCLPLVSLVVKGELEPARFRDCCLSRAYKMQAALRLYRRGFHGAFWIHPDRGNRRPMSHLVTFGLQKRRRPGLLPWPLRTVGPVNQSMLLSGDEVQRAYRACDDWLYEHNMRLSMLIALAEIVPVKTEQFVPKLPQIFADQRERTMRIESLKTKLWLVEEMGINWAEIEAAATGG